MERICVIGAGYVGLVTAACFAELGHQITCFDVDEEKVREIGQGGVPIYEPGLEPIVRSNVRSRRLVATASQAVALQDADFVFFCVDTPSMLDGGADLSRVRRAYFDVATALGNRRPILVNKSTVPPGTVDAIHALLPRVANSTGPFHVASNPEFLREGHAVADFMHPLRVIIGARDRATAEAVARLYLTLNCPVLITDPATAELTKYASNAFLATKISFINEIAGICDRIGVDVSAVARGIGLDPRIGPDFLRAGIGYGGSCLPKDTAALSHLVRTVGCHPRLLDAVREVNAVQPGLLVERISAVSGPLKGASVAVLGLAFKANTDDIRSSPAIDLIRCLLQRGARVSVHDPEVHRVPGDLAPLVRLCASPHEAVAGADVVVIATDWPQFKELDWRQLRRAMRGDVLADGRNLAEREAVEDAGFRYLGVGRGVSTSPAKVAVSLD